MISKILKLLRTSRGYTQQQVADALNIDRSTYAYYEIGKTIPNISTIIMLAKFFNVEYTDILNQYEPCNGPVFNDVDVENPSSFYKNISSVEHVYELTKEEKQLIASFRTLSEESKSDIITTIRNEVETLQNNTHMYPRK